MESGLEVGAKPQLPELHQKENAVIMVKPELVKELPVPFGAGEGGCWLSCRFLWLQFCRSSGSWLFGRYFDDVVFGVKC